MSVALPTTILTWTTTPAMITNCGIIQFIAALGAAQPEGRAEDELGQ